MPPPRQGRDSEAESAGEGYAYVVETEVHRPHPFLVSRSRAPSLSGGWRSDPGSPMLAVQTPYSKEPQFWTGTLQLMFSVCFSLCADFWVISSQPCAQGPRT